MSREKLFKDAMKRLQTRTTCIPVELRPVNLKEERTVTDYLRDTAQEHGDRFFPSSLEVDSNKPLILIF